MNKKNDTYTVNLFPFANLDNVLQDNGVVPDDAILNTVAVCFSGGGSRALSAAMGQLRGLTHLGLVEKTQLISGVSGGAWASTLYSYVPESISDDQLLGEVCADPGKLTWNSHAGDPIACTLDKLPEHNLGTLPGNMSILGLGKEAIEMWRKGIPKNEIWVRLVGKYIFQPYGLYSGYGTSKYFTWNETWFNELIADNNPALNINDFYIFPTDRYRPSLLIYGSLIPDQKKGDYELLPVVLSPYFSGVIPEFPKAGTGGEDIGGGGVDSFGFNSYRLKGVDTRLQTVDIPQNNFSLADMAGISSSFFAELINSKYTKFKSLTPEYTYWPVMNVDQNSSIPYSFADGGNLDNSGVASMLRQRMRNIISFVNSSTRLSYDKDTLSVVVDSQIPPLFGYQPYTQGHGYVKYTEPLLDPSYAAYKGNKVFEYEDFSSLLTALWDAYTAGGTAMCYQENIAVCKNAKFGVLDGTVHMLWVYNNMVTKWRDKLSDYVKIGMVADPLLYGEFPNYAKENIGLSARQVNLLAHLSCWNIISDNTAGNPNGKTNADIFKNMYAPKEKSTGQTR
jgi:hypothetical protein